MEHDYRWDGDIFLYLSHELGYKWRFDQITLAAWFALMQNMFLSEYTPKTIDLMWVKCALA